MRVVRVSCACRARVVRVSCRVVSSGLVSSRVVPYRVVCAVPCGSAGSVSDAKAYHDSHVRACVLHFFVALPVQCRDRFLNLIFHVLFRIDFRIAF